METLKIDQLEAVLTHERLDFGEQWLAFIALQERHFDFGDDDRSGQTAGRSAQHLKFGALRIDLDRINRPSVLFCDRVERIERDLDAGGNRGVRCLLAETVH